ncbi:hypothetical protein K469DRAFT_323846 [Zopfia rhizophila CBS 207.26]|uniref:Uncharacterized protein n=1 Tax=Zopfia rhizophila CBS 207.26 TaxID=1314779 RepID=A0A6A6DHK2_9PEZI|nr:hypothetical protein K469DRAFT_323846 [Zopfia rhizophila CBS 207.26]
MPGKHRNRQSFRSAARPRGQRLSECERTQIITLYNIAGWNKPQLLANSALFTQPYDFASMKVTLPQNVHLDVISSIEPHLMRTTVDFRTMKSLDLKALTYVDAPFLMPLRKSNTIAES